MKRIISLILVLLYMDVSIYANSKEKATMGYLVDGLSDIKYKDARVAFSLWIKSISTTDNIDIDIFYYEEAEKIINAYKNTKVEYLALNLFFYLKNQKTIEALSKEYWSIQKSKNTFERMILLVHKESGIKNLHDLKSKNVMIRDDNYIGELFLDKEILQEVHVDAKKHINSFLKTKKNSTAIIKTFFSQVDACIVPEYAFKLVSEMNPAISKKLTPILISDAMFTPALAIFHEKVPEKMLKVFKHNVENMDETPGGRNILSLFKMHGFHQINKKDLDAVKKYYEEYLYLQERYGL